MASSSNTKDTVTGQVKEDNNSSDEVKENERDEDSDVEKDYISPYDLSNDDADDEDDPEDLKIELDELEIPTTSQVLHKQAEKNCLCMTVDNDSELESVLIFTAETDFTINNFHCLIDNVSKCFNYVSSHSTTPLSVIRLLLTDYFYRIRHEVLFKGLCKAFNLPSQKTDMPFSLFGIESNRTPDMIIDFGDNSIAIIEVTAVSSYDKAAQSKGVESAGFESKYEREIVMLRSLDKKVSYLPVIFDMNDNVKSIEPQLKQFKDIFNLNITGMALLRLAYSSMSILTLNTKEYNMLPAALLFSNLLDIKRNHPNLSFLYENEKMPDRLPQYIEYRVSNPVYRRISNIWDRILKIMEYNELETDGKYLIILKVTDNKLVFEDSTLGLTPRQITKIVLTNNKPAFFSSLLLDTGNKRIKASESSTGYKYMGSVMKRTNTTGYSELSKITITNDHFCVGEPPVGTIEKSSYRSKLNVYNSQYYPNSSLDLSYETKMLNAISKMDARTTLNKDLSISDYKPELSFNPLAFKDLSIEPMDEVFSSVCSSMAEVNALNDGIPLKKFKVKQPFVLPLAEITSYNYASLSSKNSYFLNEVSERLDSNNMFTAEILRKANLSGYNFHSEKQNPSNELVGLMGDRRNVSMELTKIHRNGARQLPRKDRMSYNPKGEEKYDSLRKDLSKIDKRIRKLKTDEGILEDISLIRLPSKNRKTEVGSWFNKEMSHFKNKNLQSTIEGVGLPTDLVRCYESTRNIFENLMQKLPTYAGENPDMVVTDTRLAQDVSLLQGLKEEAFKQYGPLIEAVKDSYLGHAAAFVSRLCHSLLFYSQMSFNSERIRVDSLGYDNVVLIVRGGNKIFNSKSSKLFRLIYPIDPVLKSWYIGSNTSYNCEEILGVTYLITPWQLMHESVLTDGLSFYNRVVSFSVLNSKPGVIFSEQFQRIAINVLLAFHNRRQSEVFLANLRYVLLSCMGDFSGMSEILKEFVGFNYDYFQLFLRCSFMYNFPTYFKSLRSIMDNKSIRTLTVKDMVFSNGQLNNIFTDQAISGPDDMALMIYSTFLMTKAPYKRNVERAQNLKGILKIHEEYEVIVGLTKTPEEQLKLLDVNLGENETYESYSNRLFENDYKIDSKYIANLGVFADSLIVKKGGGDAVNIEWIKIMNESWDSMATSTGLRGDLADVEDFWGKKGYFVVYKDLIKSPNFNNEVQQLFRDPISDDEKRKKLRQLNQTYLQKVETKSEFWIFHAVDKTQWRGGREIYVMDIHTKQHQQPIEKFMGYLCKLLDNELISIPSDKRTQVIHHSIFEKDIDMQGCLTWYLTLDCSKWAPKSIFIKFAVMVLNMQSVPSSFKTHFLNYLDKLFYKRIYFNNSEVEVLKNNPLYTNTVSKHLIKDETVDGYYLLMPYSWVMGIFNYMSSFMHAVNQDYASYLISKSSIENLDEETSLVMYAHSDDSGGRITSTSRSLVQRGLLIYEINLKACNHLLSKKKSVVSRFYFEILSIIYIFKTLLALLPKFLGGIRFLPTDKGPAQDMSQAYSKCIEVMVAGADFSIAHIVMCFYSALVWRFYYNRAPLANDFRRPVQYFGLPAAHPLMVLLAGSDSDIVRMIANGDKRMLKSLLSLNKLLSTSVEDNSVLPSPTFLIKVRGIQKGFENVLESFRKEIQEWSVKYVNFKSTPFNFLNFLSKLNDPGFVGSLVNESTVRRLSRAYFLRSGNSVNTSIGTFTLKQLMSSIEVLQTLVDDMAPVDYEQVFPGLTAEFNSELDSNAMQSDSQIKVLTSVLSGPLKICEYMSKINFRPDNFKPSHKTLKPTHLQIVKTAAGFSSNFDPAVLVSYITQPEYRWALPDVRNLSFVHDELNKICENIGVDVSEINQNFLLQLCRHYSNKQTKSIYLYSRVPSDLRHIKTYTAFLTFLSVNSFEGKELQGLTLKLDREIVGVDYMEKELDERVYIAATLISIITSIFKVNKEGYYNDISINEIKEINWEGGTLVGLCDFIIAGASEQQQSRLLLLQANFLREMIVYGQCGTTVLPQSFFYCFLKEQRQGAGWYGEGSLMVYCDGNYYVFHFKDRMLISLETNYMGKIDQLEKTFIMEVLRINDVDLTHKSMLHNDRINTNTMFGYDWSGDLSILNRREMKVGIPVQHTVGHHTFLNNLQCYNLIYQGKNKYILKPFEELDIRSYKIYTVNTTQSYIIPLVEKMFKPEEFESILMNKGFGDIGEFIYNEVLLNYGIESYITLEEFIDGFSGSRLFEIYSDARQKKYGTFPSTISTTVYPAPRGGLLRLLYEYTEENPDSKVVKILKNVSPEFMNVRSLFPEQFTAVLSETLQENYTKLYNPAEREEITAVYKELCKYKDKQELQSSLIKIMSYWGYNTLCGMIALYNFSKNKDNYKSIKWAGNFSTNAYYSNLFVILHLGISKTMLKHEHIIRDVTLPVDSLKPTSGLNDLLDTYNMQTALSCYGLKYSGQLRLLSTLQIFNVLSGLLTDDDFVDSLESEFKLEPLLSTLPMNHKNRSLFFPMYNNLRAFWQTSNKQEFKLDFSKRNQRIPDGIVDPTTLYKKLSLNPKIAVNKFHHGQISRSIIKHMSRDCVLRVNGVVFKIKNDHSGLSSEKVITHPKFKYVRPLNLEAIVDSPDWDDFSFELETVDADIESMNDYIAAIKGEFQMYKKTTTIRDTINGIPTIYARFNWITLFGIEGNASLLDYMRQVGENIILITDTWIPALLKWYVKVSCRRVNFSKFNWCTDSKIQDCLAYVLHSSDFFTEEFIDLLVSPDRINVNSSYESVLHSNQYFNNKGEVGGLNSGFSTVLNLMLSTEDAKKEEDENRKKLQDETEMNKERSKFVKKNGNLHAILEEAVGSNKISLETAKRLNYKYKAAAECEAKLPLAKIIEDLMMEISLSEISGLAPDILKGVVTPEENISMMQMPKHFGLAFEQNKIDRKMFSDKRVQIELTSLHPDLASYIGSATLSISKKMAPIIFTNFNLWRNSVKITKFKKQNKEFLLSTMNMVINDSRLTAAKTDGSVNKHDNFWREILENCTMYFGNEGENFDQDELNSFFGVERSSRLIYNPVDYYPRSRANT